MLAGKKVLLTGVTGRIGGAIAERFAGSCELWGLARYTAEGSLEAAKKTGLIPVRADYATGDLKDLPTDFDYVLHVAAEIVSVSAEAALAANSDGPARLMKHCRNAKAFLHVSTTGVYKQQPDPHYAYAETDDLAGSYGGQYATSKLAGEGAVRAAAIILELPTVICRQNVQYGGPHRKGGLIDRSLDIFVETGEVAMPVTGPHTMAPLHEDDICNFVEPCLSVASVPAEIVNWGGDEPVNWKQLFDYAGELLGKAPRYVTKPEFLSPNCFPDPAKRQRIAGPCQLTWKQGVRKALQVRHPEITLNEVA